MIDALDTILAIVGPAALILLVIINPSFRRFMLTGVGCIMGAALIGLALATALA